MAGYRTWQTLGRQVRRGERGIAILAPCSYKACPDDEHDTANSAKSPTASARAKRLLHWALLPSSSGMLTSPKEVTSLFIHALSRKPRGTEIGDTGANAIEVASRERVSTLTGL